MNNNFLTDVEHWDEYWEEYGNTRSIKSTDPILGANGSFLRALKNNAGIFTNKKVLELGGASSYFLLSMCLFENMEATAVDYAQNGLLQLDKIFEAHGKKVKTICTDLFNYDFTEKHDLVVHWGLLEHFVDPYPVLEVSAKAMSPDAKLVFSMPNLDALGVGLWKKYDPKQFNTCIYHSDDAIIAAALKAGLVFEKRFYWGAPFLANIGYWPANKLLLFCVENFVRVLSACNRIIPFYHRGCSWFSKTRAFVFHKMV